MKRKKDIKVKQTSSAIKLKKTHLTKKIQPQNEITRQAIETVLWEKNIENA